MLHNIFFGAVLRQAKSPLLGIPGSWSRECFLQIRTRMLKKHKKLHCGDLSPKRSVLSHSSFANSANVGHLNSIIDVSGCLRDGQNGGDRTFLVIARTHGLTSRRFSFTTQYVCSVVITDLTPSLCAACFSYSTLAWREIKPPFCAYLMMFDVWSCWMLFDAVACCWRMFISKLVSFQKVFTSMFLKRLICLTLFSY